MPVFCWNLILLLEGNIFPAFLKHSCSWKSCWFDKICWCVISSGSDKYEIRDINEVREGFKTDIFNKIKSNTRLANKWEDALLKSHQNFFSRLSEVTKDVAFSIVFNDDCNQPPVDLVSHPSIKSKSKSPIKNWPAFTSGCSRQEDKRCLGSSNHTLHRLDEKS